MASAQALTEAFLWSQWRTVTKTATVSLHGNTYQVEPVLVGRKVELVFSPFNLEVIEVHYAAPYGPALPHRSPATAPESPPRDTRAAPAPATGIAYLHLVADAHHQQVAAEERIGFHALYSTERQSAPDSPQLPGQLSIDDALRHDALHDDALHDDALHDDVPPR